MSEVKTISVRWSAATLYGQEMRRRASKYHGGPDNAFPMDERSARMSISTGDCTPVEPFVETSPLIRVRFTNKTLHGMAVRYRAWKFTGDADRVMTYPQELAQKYLDDGTCKLADNGQEK